jgi:hypothetical protein
MITARAWSILARSSVARVPVDVDSLAAVTDPRPVVARTAHRLGRAGDILEPTMPIGPWIAVGRPDS